MTTYEIIYDYCSEEGYEERNCYETVEMTYEQMRDYVKVMREQGCYIISVSAIDEDGERW